MWTRRTAINLNSADTRESPEVTIADPREFLLDLFHHIASDIKTVVGTVQRLGLESHSCIITGRMLRDTTGFLYTKLLTYHQSSNPCRRFQKRAKRGGRGPEQKSRL